MHPDDGHVTALAPQNRAKSNRIRMVRVFGSVEVYKKWIPILSSNLNQDRDARNHGCRLLVRLDPAGNIRRRLLPHSVGEENARLRFHAVVRRNGGKRPAVLAPTLHRPETR